MSVIDNIMTGRNLKIKATCSCGLRIGQPSARRSTTREFVEHIIDFLEVQAWRKTPDRPSCPTACKSAWTWGAPWPWVQVLLLDKP